MTTDEEQELHIVDELAWREFAETFAKKWEAALRSHQQARQEPADGERAVAEDPPREAHVERGATLSTTCRRSSFS